MIYFKNVHVSQNCDQRADKAIIRYGETFNEQTSTQYSMSLEMRHVSLPLRWSNFGTWEPRHQSAIFNEYLFLQYPGVYVVYCIWMWFIYCQLQLKFSSLCIWKCHERFVCFYLLNLLKTFPGIHLHMNDGNFG